MKLENKNIAIIGAGPGGLTLARLLQLRGRNVKVYERDAGSQARVQGSPLDLHDDSGLAALRKAGLIEAFRLNFMPGADKKQIMNEKAEALFSDHEFKLEENFGDEHFRPEIDRGVLRKILLDSLEPETICWNKKFVSMEPRLDGWQLTFDDGGKETADLVIAADGANSRIRPYLTDIKPFYSGVMMLEGNIRDAANRAPAIHALLKGGKIMAFGKSENLLLGQKANDEIGFYASFKADENWLDQINLDWSDRNKLLTWFTEKYSTWAPVWKQLFESSELPLIPRPIGCMPPEQSWESKNNLTMLGDAAHVMPPFAGEGVNMAMRDALELSEALASENFSTVGEAIKVYENEMRTRAAAAAKESLINGEMMHAKDALEVMLDFFSGHIH